MRLSLLAIPLAVLALSLPARADSGFRTMLEEEIKIEETRAEELDRVAASDMRQARELQEAAQRREDAAAAAEKRSATLRGVLAAVDQKERRELEHFAEQMANFARNDREEATDRRAAAEILVRSARRCEHQAREHREHIGRMHEHMRIFRYR